MPHRFDPDRDTLLRRDDTVTAYLKPLDEPVYVVEPTGVEPAEIAAVTILLHGLCEHPFRFFHLARHLAQRGIQSVMPQLYGHGVPLMDVPLATWLAEAYLATDDTAKLLGAIGRRALACRALGVFHAHNFALLTDADLTEHLKVHTEQAHACYGSLFGPNDGGDPPLFLLGHSLGGLVAAEAGWRLGRSDGGGALRGVVLINPALQPIGKSKLETGIVNLGWLAMTDPDFDKVHRAINKVTAFDFPINVAWSSDAVSDIPDENRLHAADPLTLRRLPSGYLQAIQRQMGETHTRAATYPVDVLAFASVGDRIVNTDGAIRFMAALHETRDAAACPFVLFEDCPAHDPTRSTRRADVLGRIDRWIDERI
ncbi:MAG: alpha/beta fold hydrolase [Phycisphaera sp.]|nr:alpha/beta fold hydrolase [Phycisphaera sp.]